MKSAVSNIRTHIIISNNLMDEVDSMVGRRKRSMFIQQAVFEKVHREKQISAFAESAGILKDAPTPQWKTPQKTSSWVKKIRKLDTTRLESKLKPRP